MAVGAQPPYRVADIPIGRMYFDPQNPRVPPQVDGSDEYAVLKWMLDDASLIDLAASIASQGYFPGEPLLVCPRPELPGMEKPPEPAEESEYTVVEGNRRLGALRALVDPANAPARREGLKRLAADGATPEIVPCIIFPTRASILDYLGYRHITGIKEWDPLAKARYLEELQQRWHQDGRDASLRALARSIGSNAPYVGRLLTALAALRLLEGRGFFKEHDIDPDDVPFSLLSTALNYEHLVDYLGCAPDDPDLDGLNVEHLVDLATWIFVKAEGSQQTALGESRNMRFLNDVVTSENAVRALKSGEPVRSAAVLTLDPPRIFSTALAEGQRQVRLAHRQVESVDRPTGDDDGRLRDIGSRVQEILERFADGANGARDG